MYSQTVQQLDPFDSPEFEAQRVSLPYLQVLNNQSTEKCGFFITAENAEASGFSPNDEWRIHTSTFSSGESADGFISQVARFVILRNSGLMMFDRESGEYLGLFERSKYDRTKILLKTKYLVYLVAKNKQPLHQNPLQLTTKGSFNGCFGDSLKKFREQIVKAYQTETGVRKSRGERFLALSIFAVKIAPELKGDKQKSWAASIESWGCPTPDNWRNYFVGYNEELKSLFLDAFDNSEGFGADVPVVGGEVPPGDEWAD